MPTFNDLVARVRQDVLGFTKDQAAISELSASMTSSATTFTVDTATVDNVSRGLVEIDDELILVKSVNQSTGEVTVAGSTNGRGVEGTTAAAHSQYALVTQAPVLPRARIKEKINQAIQGLYPALPVFATTEVTRSAAVYAYEMPAAAKDVWSVRGQSVGPDKIWMRLANWSFNAHANTTDFSTGKSLEILDLDWITPGRKVRVLYTKEPTVLAGDSDDFATVTGYPDRVADLVVWGACSRLLPAYEAARLQQTSLEGVERAQQVSATAATKTAQYFMAMYQTRLEEERTRMFQEAETFATYQGG